MAAKRKAGTPAKRKAAGAAKKPAAPAKAARAPKAPAAKASKGARAKPVKADKAVPAARPKRAATVKAARGAKPARAAAEAREGGLDREQDPTATAKLAIGPGAEGRETPTLIPWSYGVDRVTAAAVDPDRLFVYWEVTDPAIERARAALGRGGPGAWLNLRVYDTTGLIFDGTNAHSYFDHTVDRATRQWFFQIGKPTSTTFVELGMKSAEGYFARIVRSGRAEFPRREPAAWGDPEWMTVRPGTGEVADLHRSPAPRRGAEGAPGRGGAEGAEGFWSTREPGGVHEIVLRHLHEAGWEQVEWSEAGGEGWVAVEGRIEWESPRVLTTWEAGPFGYPVEIEPPRREQRTGHSFAYRVGNVTHVVEGPWRVVIRNVGARAERQIIGTWEIHRSWSVLGERVTRFRDGRAGTGASESWLSGSELRMGGASERWRIGASELAWRGASERLHAGASEWRYAGASERALAGASERRLGGASEQPHAGASERRFEGPTAPPLAYPPAGSGPSTKEG